MAWSLAGGQANEERPLVKGLGVERPTMGDQETGLAASGNQVAALPMMSNQETGVLATRNQEVWLLGTGAGMALAR